ncbi:hemerythrin domain-containing protein [Actinomadura livida]|uniref:Hemerythrin domain-containing protein n=1 Tax=Actinomadura livida TaxID=79909 RepID=A0A7W7ID68_9ACTN|nr:MULTISPECIES: hemerythrin domain-containing protein [Actinomadura]MBB4774932.1 hemerythrin-like domain-containing protein [Actinomadura catellatispora]GGU05040.1 hemerythrin [Actinomadura livida]
MDGEALSAALEREHREIDEGIESFTAALAEGREDSVPLKRALEGLRRHIYLEEEFLFPPLREAGLMAPVFVMLREHGELWRTMDRLEAATARGPANPQVRELCTELPGLLDRHNSKEEPILYPQADAVLEPGAIDRLRRFLASGRLPEGWACRQAHT